MHNSSVVSPKKPQISAPTCVIPNILKLRIAKKKNLMRKRRALKESNIIIIPDMDLEKSQQALIQILLE